MIIEIPYHGCVIQSNAVLISGNFIVIESMLTGKLYMLIEIPLQDCVAVRICAY